MFFAILALMYKSNIKMRINRFIVPLILLSSVFLTSCGYNSLVDKEEKVKSSWAQVENVYQRRADLIPNLVNTVKGASDFEKETLTQVMEARSKATQITVDPEKLSPESIAAFQKAQSGVSSSLGRLLAVAENYPQLRATEAYRDLMVQLEGTENRISVERRKFNQSVQDYNSSIRKFPSNLTASMFGFESKGYFEAEKGAEEVPNVEF